jgi:hypothetical protein
MGTHTQAHTVSLLTLADYSGLKGKSTQHLLKCICRVTMEGPCAFHFAQDKVAESTLSGCESGLKPKWQPIP